MWLQRRALETALLAHGMSDKTLLSMTLTRLLGTKVGDLTVYR